MDNSITILEKCHVSPPPNSILTPSKIPLTFLDIPWLICPVSQRVIFYELPNSTLHFTNTVIPELKHSLSIALKHFYPLVGSVVCPSRSDMPYILYQDGDSISFIVAESNDDFSHLVKNYSRDVRAFLPLVPTLIHATDVLKETNKEEQVKTIRSLAAIQVTIFPNSGICIGVSFKHIVTDGRSINHFIKSWASTFKSKNDDLPFSSQPLLDRAKIIEDPNGYLPIVWNQWCDTRLTWDDIASFGSGANKPFAEKLRATFVLSRVEIDKVKHKIMSHFDTIKEQPPLPHVSTFVATFAFIWVCYIKMENVGNVSSCAEDGLAYYFSFWADASERKHVPKTYFGNCLTPCYGSVSKCDLLGENGLFDAAKCFMKEIKELGDGNLKSLETWMVEGGELYKTGRMMEIAASPKLRVYETDFGWGRPRKSEVVHIDLSKAISLSESRDEEGGVEIGLALGKVAMDIFTSIFYLDLKKLCQT